MTTRAAVLVLVCCSFVAFAASLARRRPSVEGAATPVSTETHRQPKRLPPSVASSGIEMAQAIRELPPFPDTRPHSPADGGGSSGRQPAPLAAPGNAAPLESPGMNLATLRAAIQAELPTATATEIEFWVQELKGMKLHNALDLLRVRRQFPLRGGRRPPTTVAPLPLQVPPAGRGKPLLPRRSQVPVLVQPPVASHFRESLAALRQGADVLLHNIANAGTPAFKRSRVVFGERSPADGDATASGIGRGVRIASIQRDWSPGRFRKTARPLDAAIAGPGFFAVQSQGTTAYTRCGAFHAGDSGRLELHIGGVRYRLAAAAAKHAAGVDGIRIATFTNPGGLESLGNGLFAATDSSGAPLFAHAPERIKAGHLEEANVDLERELDELRRLASRIHALEAGLAMISSSNAAPPEQPARPTVERRVPRRTALRSRPFDTGGWIPWR